MTEEHTSELQSHDNLVCLEFRREIFRSEEHTSELQSHDNLVCRLLLEKTTINGLGLLGAENTRGPLRDIFHTDTSAGLRDRAACNLADAVMLSRELRLKAVPELVRFSQPR